MGDEYLLSFRLSKFGMSLSLKEQGLVCVALNDISVKPTKCQMISGVMHLAFSYESENPVQANTKAVELRKEIVKKADLETLRFNELDDFDLVCKTPLLSNQKTFRLVFTNGNIVDLKADSFMRYNEHELQFFVDGKLIAYFDPHYVLGVSDVDVLTSKDVSSLSDIVPKMIADDNEEIEVEDNA